MSGNASTAVPTCQFQPESMNYGPMPAPMEYGNVGSNHFFQDFQKYNSYQPQNPGFDPNQQVPLMQPHHFPQDYPGPAFYNSIVLETMPNQYQTVFPCSCDPQGQMIRPPSEDVAYMPQMSKMEGNEDWQQPEVSQSNLSQQGDPCAQVVQVLQCYHQGGEEPEFVRKAIESLVKKLKDKRTELDALISAVTNGGKEQTSCVTIQRSLDGRLQVAGRKGVPHVVYARIWRWPNVSKNELQKMDICRIPNDHPDLICINPFHYERVVSSGYGNIDMSQRVPNPNMDFQGGLVMPQPLPSQSNVSSMTSNLSHMRIQNHYTGDMKISPNGLVDPMSSQTLMHQGSYYPREELVTYQNHIPQPEAVKNQISNFFMYGPTQQPTCVITHKEDGTHTVASSSLPSFSNEEGNHEWKNPNQSFFNPGGEKRFVLERYNHIRRSMNNIKVPDYDNDLTDWCSINYYELDTLIGETFDVPIDRNEIIIDGGTDPGGRRKGRFCLGALSNVHRTEASDRARAGIGNGIKLIHHPDGSVDLECHSFKGIFVRSNYMDFEYNVIYGSTVHKFTQGAVHKVFDLRWAYAEMSEQTKAARQAWAQAQSVGGTPPTASVLDRSAVGVDDLRRVCCSIAVSFVKGWGSGYNRSSLKETPCWIEIHLHKPLKILNNKLLQPLQ